MNKRWFALVGVLLAAAALRLISLGHVPPGVEHDEVAEVLIAQAIWNGQHALFFRQAFGQEPLFLYLAAGALAAFGWNVLALRFVSAAVGMLTVAAGARLARRLFGWRAALVTAGGLGVMLWPVFWSRVGLRGMTLPLFMCLGADALWRALKSPRRNVTHALLASLFFGLSAYTYLASRGLPILFGVFIIYLLVFDRALLRRKWRELSIALAVAALVALPLVIYLISHPDVQYRVAEVNAPLVQLAQGDPTEMLANVPRVLGMFSLHGDSTVRNNLPDRPVFAEPVWAILFYVGVCVALARLPDARYGFVLIWLSVMLTPTLVTTDAPNFVRALGALPAVMLLPGIGTEWVSKFQSPNSKITAWASRASRFTYHLVGLALALNIGLTLYDYFIRWPAIPETQFVWQSDLAAVARSLDADPQAVDVTIAGLSNNSMDAPSLSLLMQRKDVRVRWVDTGSPLSAGGTLVMPLSGGRLIVPSIVPLNYALTERLTGLGARRVDPRDSTGVDQARFTEFWLPPSTLADIPQAQFEANVSLLTMQMPAEVVAPGQVITALSTWQAAEPPYPPLKIFVHVVDAAGDIRAQHDGLDSPSDFWQPGDVIVQVHPIPLPADLPPGEYLLRTGVYDPDTLSPYRLIHGGNVLTIGAIQVYNSSP